jgi:NAD(P)H-dependent FMN reductase
MSSEKTVLVLVGSLRAASLNRRLAEVAVENAPEGARVRIHDGLGEVPFYNEDLDTADAPAAVAALREATSAADAVLIVTPEYNGTIPAVLKNAIDWVSRPYGAGAITGKPVAVIGATPSNYGGKWAHDDTRKSVGVAGATVLDGAELSLSWKEVGVHPREDAEVITAVRGVLEKLVAAA